MAANRTFNAANDDSDRSRDGEPAADEPEDLRGIRSRSSISGSLSVGPTPVETGSAREEPFAGHSADTGDNPPRSSATDFGPSPPQDNVFNTVLRPPPAAPAAAIQLASDIGPGNPANYIFAVGKPNSGKTTLQGHLLRYLFTGGHHNAEPDPAYMRDKDYFQKVRIEWDHAWRNGLFPERTVAGRPADFRYIVTPLLKKSRKPLPFGFLEISGEDFNELVKPSDRPPQLLPSIHSFLENPHCNLTFLFVCRGNHPTGLDGDDLLFSQFLDYLSMRFDRPFKQTCSAALVFADPDACQRRLQQRRAQAQTGGPLDVEGFISAFTPQTATRLHTWKQRASTFPFSVGAVRREPGQRGEEIVRSIIEPDFHDARLLYEWLYQQFTGQSLGPGPVARSLEGLKEWLRGLGGA